MKHRGFILIALAAVFAFTVTGSPPANADATTAQLFASYPTPGHAFGNNVEISDDGSTVLAANWEGYDVGRGSADVFFRETTSWEHQGYLVGADALMHDNFGRGSAISGDGNTAVVGAWLRSYHTGTAYAFVRNSATWSQQAQFTQPNPASMDIMGTAEDLSDDGSTAAISAPRYGGGGTVFIYTRSGTTWSLQDSVTPGAGDGSYSLFGHSLAMSGDGNTLLVGARYADGMQSNTGAAWVFVRSGSDWIEQAKLISDDGITGDYFGDSSVSLSYNGDVAVVGAMQYEGIQRGAAYVFTRSAGVWSQTQKLTASDGANGALFGSGVAISDDTNRLIVGAVWATVNSLSQAGEAYLFTRSGSVWSQVEILTALSPAAGDQFGHSVDIDGDGSTMVVGSPYDDTDAGTDAGSIYVFDITPPVPPDPPTNLATGDITPFSVALSWTDNATDETAYSIERSPDGIVWTPFAPLAADAAAFTDTTTACATHYVYRVRAYRSSWDSYSAYSNVIEVTTSDCPPPPDTPTDLSAVDVNRDSVELAWTDNATDETAYQVERSPNGSTWSPLMTLPGDADSYLDTTVVCGTDYWYRVQAYRLYDDQSSAYSNVLEVTTVACPAVPIPLLIAPADGFGMTNLLPGLSWGAVAGADHYELELWRDEALLQQFETAATSFTPPRPLLIGASYSWHVRAVDVDGYTSEWSAEWHFTLTSSSSAAPQRNLFDSDSPTLTWSIVPWASGYEIRVATSSGFAPGSVVFDQVIEDGGTAEITLDPLLNGTYYWQVRARQPDGLTWGAWSESDRFTIADL